jgi:hypothetical protein
VSGVVHGHHAPLLPRAVFLRRLARNLLLGLVFIAASLLLGAAGYHGFAGLAWIDALLNASMILTGMGPVDPLTTTGGKLFATFYSLFSGVAFLSIVGVMVAPMVHRFLHRFHLDVEGAQDPGGAAKQPARGGSR